MTAQLYKALDSSADFIATVPTDDYVPRYVKVRVPKRLENDYFDNAQEQKFFVVVGTYKSNADYRNNVGGSVKMPVIDAEYIKF
ncbi:hypothetical protein [Caballeronia sp. BR00000012568055]|uniref:hypothetical protein n=1 Tax=Caballeronia sp. BR00000012568055 TaxID=2918761 RepID=UPI0023F7D9AD|nr:hypothetical protein [Caballeronia sp. BR00000012568055]